MHKCPECSGRCYCPDGDAEPEDCTHCDFESDDDAIDAADEDLDALEDLDE